MATSTKSTKSVALKTNLNLDQKKGFKKTLKKTNIKINIFL